MDRYGTDHPDLRFDLPLVEISDLATAGNFGVFQSALAATGHGQRYSRAGAGGYSRKEVDELTEFARIARRERTGLAGDQCHWRGQISADQIYVARRGAGNH